MSAETVVLRSVRPDLPLQVAGATDRGRVRQLNEDAILVETGPQPHVAAHGTLCVVADGMGGHAAGEVASQLAIDTLRSEFYVHPATSPREALVNAIQAANLAIWEQAHALPSQGGMGCTLTAVAIQRGQLVVGHVGDSRAYLARDRKIAQLTVDHSWVAEQVAAGNLTPEQARNHPQRNVLRRALGYARTVDVEVFEAELEPDDVVMLCSDGLTNVVRDEEIGAVVLSLVPDRAVRRLMRMANSRGAPDNLSVIIARAGAAGSVTSAPVSAEPSFSRRLARAYAPRTLVAAAAVLFTLAAAGGLALNRLTAPGDSGGSGAPTAALVISAETQAMRAPTVSSGNPAVATDPLARPTVASEVAVTPRAVATVGPTSTGTVSVVQQTPVPAAVGSRTGRVSDFEQGAKLRQAAAVTGQFDLLVYDTQVRILGEETGQNVDGLTLWYRVEVLSGDQKGKPGYLHASTVRLDN